MLKCCVHIWPIKAPFKASYPSLQNPIQHYSTHYQSQLTLQLCKYRHKGEALRHHQLLWYLLIFQTRSLQSFKAEVESISFHQQRWTYWAWELDFRDFSLWSMLQSIEFFPLPLNWDVGRFQNEPHFFGAFCTKHTISAQSPHRNLPLTLCRGQKGTSSPSVSTPTFSFPTLLSSSTQGHHPEVGRNRGTTEIPKKLILQ